MLLAGYETTATALSDTLFLLLENPKQMVSILHRTCAMSFLPPSRCCMYFGRCIYASGLCACLQARLQTEVDSQLRGKVCTKAQSHICFTQRGLRH